MARRVRAPVAIVDTSALYALTDRSEPAHERCVAALEADLRGTPLVVSPFVLAEADYLVQTRLGRPSELALLDDVTRGAYRLVPMGPDEVARSVEVLRRYADSDIGLADAGNVVLADMFRTDRIFTLDRRHFGMMQTMDGQPFDIVPA